MGENKVQLYVKEVADLCQFKDFEKFAAHDNQHQLGTSLYSDPAIPEKIAMAQMRHSLKATKGTYTHANTMINTNLQAAIHEGLHGGVSALVPAAAPAAPSPVEPIKKTKPATFKSSVGTVVVLAAAK